MIVTEEDVASYRRAHQTKTIAYSNVNEDLFTWPEDLFPGFGYYPGAGADDTGLMIGVVVFAFLKAIPLLSADRKWLAIRHQSDGHACRQRTFVASVLDVRPPMLSALCQIAADRWPGGAAGQRGWTDRKALATYKAELKKIGLWYSAHHIEESLYPIDATQPMLDALCCVHTDLAEFGATDAVAAACEPVILVVAENSG